MSHPYRTAIMSALACIGLPGAASVAADAATDAMLARDRALELATPYEPVPGDPAVYHAAGLAQVLCSAVFVTGLPLDFALENVGYFTAPYAERRKLAAPVVDRRARTVSVAVPGGAVRTAKYLGSQGCVTYPLGERRLHFKPRQVAPRLPPADSTDWPMGDRLPADPLPADVDTAKVAQAVDAAFGNGDSQTAAFLVTWRGRIIAERYAAGITPTTPLESWSMGKSVTATLLGLLIRDGVYSLAQPAPVPEWQSPGDPRAAIRIADLLRMSSGLRIRAPFDPDFDASGPYPDHYYLYTGAFNSFHYAATRPLEWPPGTVGRYRNTDPVLVNYLIRLAVEKRHGDYLAYPQRALFDRLGIRSMVIETDPYGDLLTQGYDLAAARDWARLGNLYLQDGRWNGAQLLPADFVRFARSLAPAWAADGRPVYGGFFWINGDGAFPVPTDAYYMAGAGGQYTMIIPSHDLVVVRLGHYSGEPHADADLSRALALLVQAVPPRTASATAHLSARELLSPSGPVGLIANTAFTPGPGAAAAHEPFVGTLHLAETALTTDPAMLMPPKVFGRQPQLFPAVAIPFFTDHGDLVPFTQELIRAGSGDRGHSYWDLLVQPGEVWSEPDDDGWSRGGFPFALVNSIEGETHNGLATFLYKGDRVSDLRLQVVQQTAPFYIQDNFVAAGRVPATLAPVATDSLPALQRAHEAERGDAVPMSRWEELAANAGIDTLATFDGPMRVDDIVLSGLDYHGRFYLKGCQSAGGPLPWCDRARFGVWSVTKALANETALLRLAERFGPAVFDLKIADYVPEAARYPAWRDVRFEDAINMATGIGNGSLTHEPNDTSDGYLDPSYGRWYEARSVQQKLAALLGDGRVYPWGPGQVTRYRDQDMFILGVAMDRFLKSREGPAADLWSMLQREVFTPIGIHAAPTNRTIEADGSAGQPLMAYGYYPTVSDLVLIARLYQVGGRHGETQILYGPRIRELLPGPNPRGLPTGEKLRAGETTYLNAFWVSSYPASGGCRMFYPRMIGWGGNIVALLPGGITGIRLAHSGETTDNAEVETGGMAQVADTLSPFCH